MNLLKGALRKPVTIVVAILAILFFSYMAVKKMRIDIFPQLGLPTVYVAQPYGGLSHQSKWKALLPLITNTIFYM